ncbi:glycosyltransferase family 39 protein [bacterium]|nr:glycosyltransferase family 39 protein [bacterium]
MNFTIFIVTIITIIGAILRIICIDKDGGLWNDEYVSWSIAAIPFGKAFIKGILTQCHMPFYYLYLKFFNMFSSNDTYLRITSVIPSIISIPVMYLVGKEKCKNTGIICAIFTAFSSLLIYYGQEVRFYSLLFLFSSLSLLFTFKVIKSPRKRNLAGLLISNFLILITHTIGFVYVFFNLIFVVLKLKQFYKKFVRYTCIITAILFIIASPLVIKILFLTHSMSQWWNNLNVYRIIQVFCDYLLQ